MGWLVAVLLSLGAFAACLIVMVVGAVRYWPTAVVGWWMLAALALGYTTLALMLVLAAVEARRQ